MLRTSLENKKFFFIPVPLQGLVLVNKLVCLLQTSPPPRPAAFLALTSLSCQSKSTKTRGGGRGRGLVHYPIVEG